MQIPKIVVWITVHGMCAIGMVINWIDRRKVHLAADIEGDTTVPAYK